MINVEFGDDNISDEIRTLYRLVDQSSFDTTEDEINDLTGAATAGGFYKYVTIPYELTNTTHVPIVKSRKRVIEGWS